MSASVSINACCSSASSFCGSGQDGLLKAIWLFFPFCNFKLVSEQPELVSESGRGADGKESVAEGKALVRPAGQK